MLPAVDPRRTALLVMDFQPSALDYLSHIETLLDRAAAAIGAARRCGVQIVYVRFSFDDADYDRVPAHNMMAPLIAAAGRTRHHDSPATAVHQAIAPEPDDIVVRKTRVGAFATTNLHEQLRQRGITTLILAGVSTGGLVLSTVRDAYDRDYQVWVLTDACADPDPETHRFLTDTIFPRQVHTLTVVELDNPLLVAETRKQGTDR
jgi:nicotinamidase-related amidase